MGSRSKTAVSEDDASDFAVEDVNSVIHEASERSTHDADRSDEQMKDDQDAANDEGHEEEEEEEGEGEFVVEAIKSHLVDDFGIKFHVKWEGYEKRSEMTWEPEENLRGSADEILEKYLKRVGGREQLLNDAINQSQAKPKKRGRTSAGTATTEGKPNGKRPRKNTSHPASTTPPVSHAKASFKPPSGSWEDEVRAIDACEDADGKVMVFLNWFNGHRSQHALEQVYKRCPQKMLKFYEAHLSFTQVNDDTEPSADLNIGSSKRGPGKPRKVKKTKKT